MEVTYRTKHFEFRYNSERGNIDTDFFVLSPEDLNHPRHGMEIIQKNFGFGGINICFYDGTPLDLSKYLPDLEKARTEKELDKILCDLYWEFSNLADSYC